MQGGLRLRVCANAYAHADVRDPFPVVAKQEAVNDFGDSLFNRSAFIVRISLLSFFYLIRLCRFWCLGVTKR